MLQVQDVSFALPDRPLLRNIDFSINPGSKVGLIGVNGAGKSTLLKIIAGEVQASSGTITRPNSTGYVPQTIITKDSDNHQSVSQYVFSGSRLGEIKHKLDAIHDAMESSNGDYVGVEYSELIDEYTIIGGWDSEARISQILAGLGLNYVELSREMSTLSGGEKTKVSLARMLFKDPDLLLLDEPTNHLDLDAKTWLMEFLAKFGGELLIVSHDIQMLDKSIDKVLYINEFTQKVEQFSGNYSMFVAQRDAVDKRTVRTLKVERDKIGSLKKSAMSLVGGSPQRARRGKAILRRVERMEEHLPDELTESRSIKVDFPVSRRSGETVIRLDKVSKRYGDVEVVKPLSATLQRGKRLAVIGVNGAGKTTLLRMMAGLVEPTSGHVRVGTSVDLGYYAQEHELLDLESTVLAEARKSSLAKDGHLRNALGLFLFQGDRVFEQVRVLSGGERSRLALCKLVLQGHNALLLDEPTNNLDTLSSQRLVDALKDYEGSMVIVSHDLGFLRAIEPDAAVLMPEATVVPFNDRVFGRVSIWN
ncbi:MAG: ABC-F family ATP-binding cassette domain-containing protein [Chloroflexota bacterium]